MLMCKCIIITSYLTGEIRKIVEIDSTDYIICADGGYDLAFKENIKPSVLVGDFDSIISPIPNDVPTLKVPSEKDVTDTALAIDHAIGKGFSNILILGGIGGRLDHTLANIQNLFSYARKNISMMMIDSNNIVLPLINGNLYLPKQDGYYLSLFSFSEKCTGVTVTGVKYQLHNHTLSNGFPLGVSNEFTSNEAYIEVGNGELLISLSK